VTSPVDSALYRADAKANALVSTTKLRQTPGYLTSGADLIWVLNSDDGTVQHASGTTVEVTATVAPTKGGSKGDLTFGRGYVWLSFSRRRNRSNPIRWLPALPEVVVDRACEKARCEAGQADTRAYGSEGGPAGGDNEEGPRRIL
jgi:hypothetical protein